MCELYLSSSDELHFPEAELRQLQRHGGAPWTNLQGWGLAWRQRHSNDYELRKAPRPAFGADGYKAVLNAACRSKIHLLHLRAASSGGTCLENTQPYAFDWNDTPAIFMHNGELKNMGDCLQDRFGDDPRNGNADSEGGMTILKDMLQTPKTPETVWPVFALWAQQMKTMGIANFIVALGTDIFVHVHRRTELGGDSMTDPGLYMFRDNGRLRLSSEAMGETSDALDAGTLLWIRGSKIIDQSLTL